jgi:hypothetical protein
MLLALAGRNKEPIGRELDAVPHLLGRGIL